MDKGEASPSITSAFPNFRRCTNASDTMKEDQVISRFFRPIVPGFERELKLPSRFCQNLSGEIPDDAVLISCKGMWTVEVARCNCHGVLTLSGNGWASFIFHHDLNLGDLIWFEQTDQLVFRTYVGDLSTCEKDFSKSPDNGQAEHIRKRQMKAGCFRQQVEAKGRRRCPRRKDENPFIAHVEARHLKHNHLSIPSEFLKSTDLRKTKRAILVNASGHAWEVELASHSDNNLVANSSQRNMKLRHGWSAFFKSNNLKKGDICVFEIDHLSTLSRSSNIVMKVKVVRIM